MHVIHSIHHGFQKYQGYPTPNWELTWATTDSKEHYEKNLAYVNKWKKYFGNWPYEGVDIHYRYNNLGMRCDLDCDENFDYSKYTVFVGCSHVEGVGVPNSQTIPSLYENITDEPTLNFGVGGSGQESIYHVICWLLAHRKPPKKIIVLWSYQHRQLFVLPPSKTNNIGTNTQYLRNTVGDVKFELSQAPALNNYVKPDYFLEQALLKNSLYVKIVEGFKKMHEIHDFDVFAAEVNPYLPEHLIERFTRDKKLSEEWNNEIVQARLKSYENGTLGEVIANYHARDAFFYDYNSTPADNLNVVGGHYGPAVNSKIANYIAEIITK